MSALEWDEYGSPARFKRARHARHCRRDCHGSFVCSRCGRLFGWCHGASDDHPDACTFCWAVLDRAARRWQATLWAACGLRVDQRPDTADRSARIRATTMETIMKKAKKKAPKAKASGKTGTLRAQALATTAKPAAIAAGVKKYAKHHGLTPTEATAKLMTIAVGRVAALSKYNAKPAKKTAAKKPASRKSAKAAPARTAKRVSARPAKAKRSGKPRLAKTRGLSKALGVPSMLSMAGVQ